MDSKSQRLTEIKKIIQKEHVTSQDELLKNLISKGFNITQATLSRDLKLLKVAKMPGSDGLYCYVLPNATTSVHRNSNTEKLSLEGFLSIEFSGNIGVINTVPAFSHTISSTIDSIDIQPIMGTLAGNDTIIFAIREGFTFQDVKAALLKEFPDLIDKLL
jgi:transcriptional regulator of arginine metabolism